MNIDSGIEGPKLWSRRVTGLPFTWNGMRPDGFVEVVLDWFDWFPGEGKWFRAGELPLGELEKGARASSKGL